MNILYATDGSPGALAAAHLLASLPLGGNGQVTILTVVPPHDDEDGQAALAAAREVLRDPAGRLGTQVRRGNPLEEILRATEEHSPDLLVVGASGRAGLARFFLGSVAERVARHAPCPVLVARPVRAGLREWIVGVDGSPSAAHTLEWLRQFPVPDQTEIRLLTVLPRVEELTRTSRLLPLPLMGRPDAEAFIERLRQDAHGRLDSLTAPFAAAGKRAVTEIRSGDPARTLLDAAEDEGADLLVVGTHGLSAVEQYAMGSVSERVLRHAHCSVLVGKP